jgi:hypothetical protein
MHFQSSNPGVANYEINFSKEERVVLKAARETYMILLNNLVWVRGNIITRSSPVWYTGASVLCVSILFACTSLLWI